MDTKIYLINSLKLGTFIYNQFKIIHKNKMFKKSRDGGTIIIIERSRDGKV